MKIRALVTGASGFIGRNLAVQLAARQDVELRLCGRSTPADELAAALAEADVVFHLAGVNRPERAEDFAAGNAGFTTWICELLRTRQNAPKVIYTSSIQAELDNPYGKSKRDAEAVLVELADRANAEVSILRLKNVFGKWSRPNYNSVVATFCHNIAHDLPIEVRDAHATVELVHVDDVVDALVAEMESTEPRRAARIVDDEVPSYRIALGELAGRLQAYREMQATLSVPDFSVRFNHQLYSTYLSYVPPTRWGYDLERQADARGDLAEFIKSPWFGQVFVSRTMPGITRGNHFHQTKTEKFFVVAGDAVIRFRHVEGDEIVEHWVRGEEYRVVDIPPGYTHSITNVGRGELVTLFWASEVFDPDRPDTFFLPVELASVPEAV
jgi:UDP-2-acetamido-2,6-beta-L-arabino-hexul-4-ose reductase